MRRDAGLTGPGGAGHQNAAALDKSPCRPACHPTGRCRSRPVRSDAAWSRPSEEIGRTEMPCSSMRNGYSFVPWVDPRYFDDAQAPRRDLFPDTMVQDDHAVGDEFLDAVPGQLVRPVPLGGDDRGQSFLLEPVEQAADFGAQDTRVRHLAEERFNRVEDDSLRANPLDSVGNSNEEAIEVILAGFRNLASRDVHVVQEQLLLGHQVVQVETQRGGVLGQVRDRFLERHEHARFVVLCGASNQELQSEQRLSGTGASADQSGTPGWQPSTRDFVQPLDSGRRLSAVFWRLLE